MADQDKTMVKTTVDNELNATIEAIQEQHGVNKHDATKFLLSYGQEALQSDHRLRDAEPQDVPDGAPRNSDGDPVLNDGGDRDE